MMEGIQIYKADGIPGYESLGFKADNFEGGFNVTGDTPFHADLATSLINVGHGHDPYNHVGRDIVTECTGMPLLRSS